MIDPVEGAILRRLIAGDQIVLDHVVTETGASRREVADAYDRVVDALGSDPLLDRVRAALGRVADISIVG